VKVWQLVELETNIRRRMEHQEGLQICTNSENDCWEKNFKKLQKNKTKPVQPKQQLPRLDCDLI